MHVRDGLEPAQRRFKREVVRAGTFRELKQHEFAQSKSQKRRRKDRAALSRLRKAQRKLAAHDVGDR